MEFATGALGTLLPKLGELLLDEYNLHKGLKKGIKDLMDEPLVIQAALVRVSDVPLDQLDPQVKIWANDVRELSFAIEDSLDSFMVRVEGLEPTKPHTFFGFIKKASKKVTKLKVRREIANDINDVKIQVKEVKERYDRYKDVIGNTNARTEVDPRLLAMYNKVSDLVGIDKAMDELTEVVDPLAKTSSADDTDLLPISDDHRQFVGVQETSDEIIKRLMSDGGNSEQQIKILSIVGPGGLGKTTLAKAVYHRMPAQFDYTAFVSVGRNPDLKKVFKDILLQIDKQKYSDFSAAAATVQMCITEIHGLLKNKRYFLIFDDIWNIQAWEIIRCTLVESNIGSIVITTTRIYDVAFNAGDVYKLEPLSHDNSEELIYKRLFGSKVKLPDEQTQLIQKLPDEQTQLIQKLLHKCGGVPLAIITIANLLSSTPKEDWYKVYNSIGSGAANGNDFEHIKKVLLLSYYDLPIYLRACLLHLSIFPEDYMVRKDALIWMWVTEGFIRDESGVGLFEIGERYFHELINRSLIQPVEISHGGGIIGCRVHDVILDMICSIAQEGSFVTILNSNKQQHTSMEFKARRLALHKEFVGDQCLQANTGMSQVRSFNAFMCHTAMIPPLVSFQVLRVLAIEDCSFQTEGGAYSLEHIGELLHLRYLGLQKTSVRELPKEVGKLKYLEVLDLRQTGIPELPDSVSLLRRLKCLRADGGSTEVPDWIGTLTSLEELSLNDISSCPNFVKEVSKLTELRNLKVWIRWLDERSKKALVKSLGNLQKIQVLHLDGGLWIEDDEWEGYVPPRQLRCLSLRTKSSRLPRWIKDSFLPNLSHLSVDVRVLEAEDLKILGSFPELTTLELFVPNSVSLLFQGHPNAVSAFPKLRHCYTSGMLRFLPGAAPQLESVHFNVSLSALNGTTFQCGFLGDLPLLMEVRVEIFHSDVEVYHAEVEESLRIAVKVHGNCPTLHVSKFELSSNEDAEKEEDDIELEEEDEEDWYSPTAKAT